MRDYTGKTVFVGLDVHKKTYSVVCICDKTVVKKDTLEATPSMLLEYLEKYFPQAHIKTVYEAGFCGFVLHRFLQAHGIESIVVNAGSVEMSARDRVKTDKRDALKLATQLEDGRLRGIHIPEVYREGYREISRLREKVAQDKRRVGNRLKSLLMRQGLMGAKDDPRITQSWVKSVLEFSTEPSVKYCLEQCVSEWLLLSEKVKEIEKELAKQACVDEKIEKVYRSVPGIGPLSARVLANELGDMSQFSNEKKLFSFTGLTPREYSSGEYVRQGHMSRQGRSVLRKILIEASWVAIAKDPSLRIVYDRLSHRGGKRAIVGVARRLIGRIRSCLLSGKLYEIN